MYSPYPQSVFLIINQQVTPLTKEVTTFGRLFDNDIVLQSETVSRHHAEIHYVNGQYILVDKNSTSGTFVNGSRVVRCLLNSGDVLSLANIQIMFVNNNSKIADHSALATNKLSLKIDKSEQPDGS